MENLLLLLLRCLAVLLIALLVARPFIPTGLAGSLLSAARFERIIVLDDSLSMQARGGNQSAMETSKEVLTRFVRQLAANNTDDTLTIILASDPSNRVLNSARVDNETEAELLDAVEGISGGDGTARLAAAFQEVENAIAGQPADVNRVVYVLSDLRRRDWLTAAAGAEAADVIAAIRKLSEQTAGCFLIDTGDERAENLLVAEIRPQEKTLVAGVSSRFDVVVKNNGEQPVSDLEVRFTAGQSLPLSTIVPRLNAGEEAIAPFTFVFAGQQEQGELSADERQTVKLQVELIPPEREGQDRLEADNTRYFAARVAPGVPVLLVDGDPQAAQVRSESFFLKRALEPPGDVRSGIAPTVITGTELDVTRLDDYQVSVLCNLYRISQERLNDLERWTRAGGGLVLMLGDQVDEQFFAQQFVREGEGLSPIALTGLRGDETERTFVKFRVLDDNHPMMRVFAGQNNPFLERANVFRWWGAEVNEKAQAEGRVSLIASFTDAEESPAVVQQRFGEGRVLAVTIPADADWTSWPAEPSFVIAMQEVVRFMAPVEAAAGELRVGQPLRDTLDLSQFQLGVSVQGPEGPRQSLQASPPPGGDATVRNTDWRVEYPRTNRRGFYDLELTRTDGATQHRLFAVNCDPAEGDLTRVQAGELQQALAGANIVLGSPDDDLDVSGARREVWQYLLLGLVAVLFLEQSLGWLFGTRR